MYTGLEKVVKPKQIVITIDLTENVREHLGEVLHKLGDNLDGGIIVQGGAGNVGYAGETVGLWTAN